MNPFTVPLNLLPFASRLLTSNISFRHNMLQRFNNVFFSKGTQFNLSLKRNYFSTRLCLKNRAAFWGVGSLEEQEGSLSREVGGIQRSPQRGAIVGTTTIFGGKVDELLESLVKMGIVWGRWKVVKIAFFLVGWGGMHMYAYKHMYT